MGIKTQKIEPHWNYLLAIERDLDEISRFVEFDEKNFDCFSIEIARVLLASAAEVDVVCKQICKSINPESKADNIHKYRTEIIPAFPGVPQFQIILPRFGLTLTPWDEWNKPDGVPFWWTAYNKIKHHRDSEYHRAALKNALNSVAGLFVMVLYLYKDKARQGELLPSPQLLRVDDSHYGGFTVGGYEAAISYEL
jgi:hypothetical protein